LGGWAGPARRGRGRGALAGWLPGGCGVKVRSPEPPPRRRRRTVVCAFARAGLSSRPRLRRRLSLSRSLSFFSFLECFRFFFLSLLLRLLERLLLPSRLRCGCTGGECQGKGCQRQAAAQPAGSTLGHAALRPPPPPAGCHPSAYGKHPPCWSGGRRPSRCQSRSRCCRCCSRCRCRRRRRCRAWWRPRPRRPPQSPPGCACASAAAGRGGEGEIK
jgi:hypothetical protein